MKKEYAFSVLIVAITTAVSFAIFTRFALINLVMIYLLGTVAVAARGHRGPAALSSALSVLAFDFFFVPPRFSFTVTDAEYVFTFIVMFIVAMMISDLTVRLRSEAEAAREGERRTAMMHAFSQNLGQANGAEEIIARAVPTIEKTFDGEVMIFIPGLSVPALSEKEKGVVDWVFNKGEPAGLGTPALSAEPAVYIPIQGAAGTVGVFRLLPRSGAALSEAQSQLLSSFGQQMALALHAKEATRAAETEQLRSSLLSSVSHDFRTPLTAIVGSAGALLAREEISKNPKAAELAETIQEEGERMSRQIQNLLEATRFESGSVQLKTELYPLEEVLGSALERLEKTLKGRTIMTSLKEDLPAVRMDALLMEQVFINLIENATRHAPSGPIDVEAIVEGDWLKVMISDRGPGLRSDELERVFEKFYRQESSKGAGLGLSICRGVVKAHGGRIWAENRAGGGANFCFTLPLEPARV